MRINEMYNMSNFIIGEYKLYPIMFVDKLRLLREWKLYCKYIELRKKNLDTTNINKKRKADLFTILYNTLCEKYKNTNQTKKFIGVFSGQYDWGYIPINYKVIWID